MTVGVDHVQFKRCFDLFKTTVEYFRVGMRIMSANQYNENVWSDMYSKSTDYARMEAFIESQKGRLIKPYRIQLTFKQYHDED